MTVRGIRRLRGGTEAEQNQNQNQNQGTNDLIASMAKGLAQVQTGAPAQSDVLGMLNQISQQLSQLQGPAQPMNQGQNQIAGGSQQGQNGGTVQNTILPYQGSANSQGSGSQQTDPVADLQRLVSQLLQNNQQQQLPQANSNAGSNQAGGSSNQQIQQPTAVKTAAQALSEAQYELSVELENSLQKLKQVISESEKLADKIGNLLGEESNAPKS
ncbi:MAG: hypothetical protein K0Q77_2909 [Anaerosporomusa subterranea]|nr:hypothetical protein [Anaerosporomusa subterranea]